MTGAKMQQLAVNIEFDLRKEYDCERYGIGGIANSDHIRRVGFFHAMAMVLMKYYYGDNIGMIDNFIENAIYYAGERMDDINSDIVDEIYEKYSELYKSLKQE